MSEQGDNSKITIDEEFLIKTLEDLSNSQKTISEATAVLRNKLGNVLETKGWNKAALARVRAMFSKSDTALADDLRTFVPMFEAFMRIRGDDLMGDLLDTSAADAERAAADAGAE